MPNNILLLASNTVAVLQCPISQISSLCQHAHPWDTLQRSWGAAHISDLSPLSSHNGKECVIPHARAVKSLQLLKEKNHR